MSKKPRGGDLPMWTVYDHPKDYPNSFVARLWKGTTPTELMVISPELNVLREALLGMGLSRLQRHADDDPAILETWL